MIEKNQEAKIRSGAPKREPICYQTTCDIVIPKGTILRSNGSGEYSANIGFGDPDKYGKFIMDLPAGTDTPAGFKRVIAA